MIPPADGEFDERPNNFRFDATRFGRLGPSAGYLAVRHHHARHRHDHIRSGWFVLANSRPGLRQFSLNYEL